MLLQQGSVPQDHVKSILRLYETLQALPNLSPSKEVNACFDELIGIAVGEISIAVATEVLNDANIRTILPNLHQICSRAECLLESHWADKITQKIDCTSKCSSLRRLLSQSCSPWSHVQVFPYYKNYKLLAQLELNAISMVCSDFNRVAFIGSGPLPLTSLCLLRLRKQGLFTNFEVMNVDCNLNAITQSRRLCQRLGRYAKGMRFFHTIHPGDVDLKHCDVVYLAALAGLTQSSKEDIVLSTLNRMKDGALLIIRSVYGMRRLLYPAFDPTTDRLRDTLEICLTVHPYNKVVNSIVVCRKRLAS